MIRRLYPSYPILLTPWQIKAIDQQCIKVRYPDDWNPK